MTATMSLKNKINSTISQVCLLMILWTTFSCKEEKTDYSLNNSIWEYQGDTFNCKVYYQFNENTYISINPCYSLNGEINQVAWETGKYQDESEQIVLTIENSCENEKIDQIIEFNYNMTSEFLTLYDSSQSYDFVRVTELPTFPTNIEYGYWSFDQYGYSYWNHIESCSLIIE